MNFKTLKETVAHQSGLNNDEVQKALKEQLESHVEQLKKQMKEIREENDLNQKKCHDLQEYVAFETWKKIAEKNS